MQAFYLKFINGCSSITSSMLGGGGGGGVIKKRYYMTQPKLTNDNDGSLRGRGCTYLNNNEGKNQVFADKYL